MTVPVLVRETLSEEREIERRKCILIFYNIQESSSPVTKDRVTHDTREVVRLCRKIIDQDVTDQTQHVLRLGQKSESNKIRPLKVIFDCKATKYKILSNSYKV